MADAQPRITALEAIPTEVIRHASRRTFGTADRFLAPTLPAALTRLSRAEVSELIAARRSVRGYTAEPLPRPELLQVCRAGVEAATGLAVGSAGPARWLVVVRAVRDTAPGLYEYRDGDLTREADLPPPDVLAGSVVEPFAAAPCLIQPMWNLGSALVAEGTDGYLNLLLRTGFSLNAAYLVACRLGIGGCLIRDLHAAVLSQVEGWRDLGNRPFLALALGYEATGRDAR